MLASYGLSARRSVDSNVNTLQKSITLWLKDNSCVCECSEAPLQVYCPAWVYKAVTCVLIASAGPSLHKKVCVFQINFFRDFICVENASLIIFINTFC